MTKKVTFNLLDNKFSQSFPLTLDGVLSYYYVKDIFTTYSGRERYLKTLQDGEHKDFISKLSILQSVPQDLSLNPIKQIQFNDMPIVMLPYPKASWLYFDTFAEYSENWRKRWNNKMDFLCDFGSKKRKIKIDSGANKSYDVPINVIVTDKLIGYVEVTDLEYFTYLIQQTTHIGKKSSQGLGIVKNVIIEDSDFNINSICRPIPESFVTKEMLINSSCRSSYLAWKPPYWFPDNFAECLI